MKEGAYRPSLLDIGVTAGVTLLATNALSQRQRRAIRERDEHACQFPHPEGHVCSGACEAHHVRPQQWLKDQGVRRAVRDRASNILLVCENAHKLIHPMVVFDAPRNQLLAAKQVYWNPAYDETMIAIAEQRTKQARQSGWQYPGRVMRTKRSPTAHAGSTGH